MTTAHRIGATGFATPSDTEIEVTRVVDAPRELVFDCWTKAEHVTKWMLGPDGWTMPVCEIDLRPGGSWHFAWRKGDGCEMEMHGTYREISPPERLVSTERWGAGLAGDAQHRCLHGSRRPDARDLDDALPVEGGARRGARHGHQGRHGHELRSPGRVPRLNPQRKPPARATLTPAASTCSSLSSPRSSARNASSTARGGLRWRTAAIVSGSRSAPPQCAHGQ